MYAVKRNVCIPALPWRHKARFLALVAVICCSTLLLNYRNGGHNTDPKDWSLWKPYLGRESTWNAANVSSGLSTRGTSRDLWNAANVSSAASRDLLIFSYMRSGSCVTGRIFRETPGTFYVFEPLIPLLPYHYATNTRVCNMSKLLCRSGNGNTIKQAVDILRSIYSCRIRELPKKVLIRILQEPEKSGAVWETLKQCLDGGSLKVTKESCLDEIESACRNSVSIVTKVLRLGFSTMETLISDFPSLQVLLLARDPRAIVNSRIRTDWFPLYHAKPEKVYNDIDSLCFKMTEDFASSKTLQTRYPDRIYVTSIETMMSGWSEIERVHHFINKNISDQVRTEVIKPILEKSAKNDYEILHKWQQLLEPDYRAYVEKRCITVIAENA